MSRMNGRSRADCGGSSTRMALANDESGIAISAPNGPSSADQKITDRNVSVMFKFTEPATNLCWITDWISELMIP